MDAAGRGLDLFRAAGLGLIFAATHFGVCLAADKPFTPAADQAGAWGFKEDAKLPNVLILGDSISIGYTRFVRTGLAGKANVHRPMRGNQPDNCGDTSIGLAKIDEWLGGRKWDVIHFNWGLWDLCYRNPASKEQGNRDKVAGKLSTSPEDYEKNLEQLVKRLEATGAKLIWASTTVVPDGEAGRFVGDDVKYNAVAARVMQRHSIPTDDLHAVSKAFPASMSTKPGDVHYTAEGYQKLADQVVVEISKILPAAAASTAKPNILFIAIDDMNDMIGHLGAKPSAKTPNLDKLASRGTTFLNAHCNAPVCNPSRTSLMFGVRPSSTGVYGLAPAPRKVATLKDRVSLPQHFAAQGYFTAATGKIYHKGTSAGGNDSEFEMTAPLGGVGTRPPKKLVGETPMGNNPLIDWGVWPLDNDDTGKGDYKVASWTIERIKSAPKDRPFFIAAGFFLPHVPCYATQKWFDLYPDDDSIWPDVRDDDRNDTPRFSWYLHWKLPEPRIGWLKEKHQWRNLVRSYLASTSFMDSQVGRVLDALDEAGVAQNTIVVVWGDNGWHLGEKGITGKNSLWDRSTRVPLIFAGPGVKGGQRCMQPAELMDIYPTLVGLTGVSARDGLEGLSLAPQLQDAATKRERPAITTANQGNHAIHSEFMRFIRYADGSEELYDLRTDPNQWTNLAGKPGNEAVLAEHRKWLPKIDLPPAPGSADRILTYDKTTDEAEWEGMKVKRGDPIPQ